MMMTSYIQFGEPTKLLETDKIAVPPSSDVSIYSSKIKHVTSSEVAYMNNPYDPVFLDNIVDDATCRMIDETYGNNPIAFDWQRVLEENNPIDYYYKNDWIYGAAE